MEAPFTELKHDERTTSRHHTSTQHSSTSRATKLKTKPDFLSKTGSSNLPNLPKKHLLQRQEEDQPLLDFLFQLPESEQSHHPSMPQSKKQRKDNQQAAHTKIIAVCKALTYCKFTLLTALTLHLDSKINSTKATLSWSTAIIKGVCPF